MNIDTLRYVLLRTGAPAPTVGDLRRLLDGYVDECPIVILIEGPSIQDERVFDVLSITMQYAMTPEGDGLIVLRTETSNAP